MGIISSSFFEVCEAGLIFFRCLCLQLLRRAGIRDNLSKLCLDSVDKINWRQLVYASPFKHLWQCKRVRLLCVLVACNISSPAKTSTKPGMQWHRNWSVVWVWVYSSELLQTWPYKDVCQWQELLNIGGQFCCMNYQVFVSTNGRDTDKVLTIQSCLWFTYAVEDKFVFHLLYLWAEAMLNVLLPLLLGAVLSSQRDSFIN